MKLYLRAFQMPAEAALKNKVVFYKGDRFLVHPGVYEAAEDTFLLADNLDVKKGERLLELGTGCGILSILAAKSGASVVSTDINPAAIKCAKENAANNGVLDLIDFRLGDLFEPVEGDLFDFVIFNPPYLPIERGEALNTPLDCAWEAGEDGRLIIDRFLSGLEKHLVPKGRTLFVQSSLSDISKTLKILAESGFQTTTTTKKMFFEQLYLISASKNR